MQQVPRYTFHRNERLKSRKQISELFSKGKHFTKFPFKVVWKYVDNPENLQAGFAVSSRNFKKAVDRNHIKRRMREAYRLQKHDLQVVLLQKQKSMQVFFMYIGKDKADYTTCSEQFEGIIKRLIKLCHEVD